ncbi:hypothetical protein [Rhizobium dioscoreae]|uniref:hypothetical protein n=1 Tax=Rhizobium sp. NBRC 114257 TaxID=2994519 RepID=UPI00255333C6|nr:hypothetical protein [Rhizobium sp. NBRC 114257]
MPIAHRGNHFGKAVIAKGSIPRVVATGMWGRDEAEIRSRLEAWNQPIHRIRGTPPPKAVYCDLLIGFKSMAYVMHYSDFPH